MKTSTNRADDLLLLNAYLDGELDAAGSLDFERRLATDKGLKSAHDRLVATHAVLSRNLSNALPPYKLRQTISAIHIPSPSKHFQMASWRQMAASLLVAAAIGSSLTWWGTRQFGPHNSFEAIIAGHERSLLATSPVDVASSDHHTVRPWFDQHLALSPPIPDLTSAGYVLLGGRIDIVDAKPTPTLVYQLHQHLISVVAVPSPNSRAAHDVAKVQTRDGYSVLSWPGQDFEFYAVSDISAGDLQNFQSQWRQASGAE